MEAFCHPLARGPSIFHEPSPPHTPRPHTSSSSSLPPPQPPVISCPSPSFSLALYRAVFCQRRGVGTSHLLLLQRDSHGVQLPGEGMDLMKSRSASKKTLTRRTKTLAGALLRDRPRRNLNSVWLKCNSTIGADGGGKKISLCR